MNDRYGEVEYNAESAANILVDLVQDQSGKQYKSASFLLQASSSN